MLILSLSVSVVCAGIPECEFGNGAFRGEVCSALDQTESSKQDKFDITVTVLPKHEAVFSCEMKDKMTREFYGVRFGTNQSEGWLERLRQFSETYKAYSTFAAQKTLAHVVVEITPRECEAGRHNTFVLITATDFVILDDVESCEKTVITEPLRLVDICRGGIEFLALVGARTFDAVLELDQAGVKVWKRKIGLTKANGLRDIFPKLNLYRNRATDLAE